MITENSRTWSRRPGSRSSTEVHVVADGDREAHRADRPPSCSAGPATPVTAMPTSAPSTWHARRPSPGRLLGDHRALGHAEHVELHLVA